MSCGFCCSFFDYCIVYNVLFYSIIVENNIQKVQTSSFLRSRVDEFAQHSNTIQLVDVIFLLNGYTPVRIYTLIFTKYNIKG